ncbi:class I SAM-dependent methyltransferase [Thermaurantiacus sp.]
MVGVLRRFGRIGRQLAWNIEYRQGAEFVGARSPVLLELLAVLLPGRRVVELACGDGSLAAALGGFGHATYQGFDISSVAIALAIRRQLPGMTFAVADMESWTPAAPFDLLLVEEAIYYLAPDAQVALLERAFAAMGPDGLAVIVLHSATKHAAIIERLGQRFRLVTDRRERDRAYLVLGPRP